MAHRRDLPFRHDTATAAGSCSDQPTMSRGTGLQARWRDRLWLAAVGRRRGGRLPRVLRRALAVALIVTAGVMALRPPDTEPGTPVLVLTRDLPVGATIAGGDVQVLRQRLVPDGAMDDSATVIGRTLAGRARRGEVLTDVRLADPAGPDPGPGRVAVPVQPADPAIVELLGPGMHVAVIAVTGDGASKLLAGDAVVLSIADGSGSGHPDRPVVLAVPADSADRIAATALAGTIALRFT